MTFIVTKRLVLTDTNGTNNHRKIMAGWLNDQDIVRYSEQRHLRHDEYTQHAYLVGMHSSDKFMEIHVGEQFIGTITAHVDENNSVANVGILIGEKSEWSKGYGTEAWIGFCDHLLNNGIRKIESGCMAINMGMIHIFRKSGMFYEGRRHAYFLCGQETIDMVCWGKFA